MRRSRTLLLLLVALLLAGVVPVAVGVRPAAAAGARTFHVDPVTGSDTFAGTRAARPWRTLNRVTRAQLRPGDRVLLRAGRTHRGSLTIAESGSPAARILVTRYGVGASPVVTGGSCVTVTGSRVTVRGLAARGCTFAGFTIRGAYDVVDRVVARGNVAGVHVHERAYATTVSGSSLLDNRRMVVRPGPDDDYGAHGVLVNGDRTTIRDTTINGHRASSPDYGVDGSAIEVFAAVGTRISNVRATDNKAFLELGGQDGDRAADTVLAGSRVRGSLPGLHFLVTRGAGQSWGPVAGTVVTGNDVRLSGADSIGVGCYGGCGLGVLTVRGNTIAVAGGWSWADGPFVSEDNVYSGWWGAPPGLTDLLVALS